MSLYKPQQRPHFITSSPLGDMGLRTLPITLVFSAANTTISDDLVLENENGVISGVQTVYIDNSANPSHFLLLFQESGQAIYAEAFSQGYYSCIVHQSCAYSASVFITGGAVNVGLQFLNVAVQPSVWVTQNFIGWVVQSTNAGNAIISLAATGQAGKMNFITGFDITGTGVTAAQNIAVTLGSLAGFTGGSLTATYDVFVPLIANGNVAYSQRFSPPLRSPVLGGTTTLTVPAMGAGGTASAAVLYGYSR